LVLERPSKKKGYKKGIPTNTPGKPWRALGGEGKVRRRHSLQLGPPEKKFISVLANVRKKKYPPGSKKQKREDP